MTESELIKVAIDGMMLVLILSLPPIVAASVVGVLVSLFQALTQIQEQTLSFVLKLIAVIVTMLMTSHWIGGELYQYSDKIFTSIGGT